MGKIVRILWKVLVKVCLQDEKPFFLLMPRILNLKYTSESDESTSYTGLYVGIVIGVLLLIGTVLIVYYR